MLKDILYRLLYGMKRFFYGLIIFCIASLFLRSGSWLYAVAGIIGSIVVIILLEIFQNNYHSNKN